MASISATSLNRKSGGAQWRDLQSSRKVENLTFQQSLALALRGLFLVRTEAQRTRETCGFLFRCRQASGSPAVNRPAPNFFTYRAQPCDVGKAGCFWRTKAYFEEASATAAAWLSTALFTHAVLPFNQSGSLNSQAIRGCSASP
jgi:hypothetical protein